MNKIKTQFSIKDLENLSGVKAHTIRIWEKRYNLLEPNRTVTNIRHYNISNLQKLLNIAFLNKNGYKISKIAELKKNDIQSLVKEIASNNAANNHHIDLFKVAMLNFDQWLFHSTFDELLKEQTLSNVFHNVISPFFSQIGILWQTDTITPAHEHFIFELIKQKLLVHTAKAINPAKQKMSKKIFALFLPDNEIHELGLLFINYELTLLGHQSIYLGQSVPVDSLCHLMDYYDEITFISSFTIKPEKEAIDDYLDNLSVKVLQGTRNKLLVSGMQVKHINTVDLNDKTHIFESARKVLESLKDKQKVA